MKPEPLFELWVYLSSTPLFGLTLTLFAFQTASVVYRRAGLHPLANPVAIAVLIVVAVLAATGVSYRTYFEGAQFVHFLLGTATVALAVPLYNVWNRFRSEVPALLATLAAGACASIAITVAVCAAFRMPRPLLLSMIPKSVTAPIAMGVAKEIGGAPTLAAVFAVSSGIIGAVGAKYVLDALGIRPWPARGFAIGLASHGIGTARAWSVHPEAGAYASLAMGMHGIVGAFVLPWATPWIIAIAGL